MNSNDNQLNMSIPLLTGVIKKLTSNGKEGSPLETISSHPIEEKLIAGYSSEISENTRLISNFEKISTELLQLGYTPKVAIHSFLVSKFNELDQAIDFIEHHDFIESDDECCFVCDKKLNEHQKKNQSNLNTVNQITKEEFERKLKSRLNNSNDIILDVNPQINTFQCEICFDDITQNEVFHLNCRHNFCKNCIIDYLKEEIKNSRVIKIKCPYHKCDELFTESIIKSLLETSGNSDYISKYTKFCLREKQKNDPNLAPCPIVNCEGFAPKNQNIEINPESSAIKLETNPSSIKEKLICDKGHAFCSLCNQVWHGDSDCEVDKEIKEFGTYSGFIVKKCPKCKTWTEKNEGCNHMKCKICSYNWCWLCEQECKENHYVIENTPCFGKQFNNESNPEEMMVIMMIVNSNIIIRTFFFLFLITMFVIKLSIRQIYRRNNLPRNENHDNDNIIGERPSKVGLFIAYFCLSTIIFLIMMCMNGYILFSMMMSKGGMENVNNLSKRLLKLTYLILFALFFPIAGPMLNISWYLFVNFYTAYQLIIIN